MNVSTLIGLIVSSVVFIGAVVTSSQNMLIFLDQHAILIVCGGTMAATLVCFPLPKIIALGKIFLKRLLGQNKKDYMQIIKEISMLSQASRKGPRFFDTTLQNVSDPFLRDAATLLYWAESDINEEQLRDLIETRAETHYERYMEEANIFRTISKFPPAFGLMGTTLGMITLLQSLGADGSKGNIGPAMSIALVATFYGIVLSNLILIPIAENLTAQTKEDLVSRRMVVEGVMLIHLDTPTMFIEEKLKSFLLPGERGDVRRQTRMRSRGSGNTRNAA